MLSIPNSRVSYSCWNNVASAFSSPASVQRISKSSTHTCSVFLNQRMFSSHRSISIQSPSSWMSVSYPLNPSSSSMIRFSSVSPSHDGEKDSNDALKVNLLTIPQSELETLLEAWNHPKYRAAQILQWIHQQGIHNFDDMKNLPKALRKDLMERSKVGSLQLQVEQVSKDGTRKRAYRLHDGQLIESVLMPYEDGRFTACISSQAGCAQNCSFCATGQMGFARQLTSDEIFEQVAHFASELKKQNQRLSNVVLMGMGEPLANYRNVMEAIKRMNLELGIGARKITISTVGIVPNIKKLMEEDIQVGLAVSLHSANDEDRSLLLPANKRYGGLEELMSTLREYIDNTKRRITFEWALIEGQNDKPEVARQLGKLLERHGIRKDLAHINLIPLNPTGGYQGSPSGRKSVDEFVKVLDKEFGLTATPRVRRGIDIDAGCGQLKAAVKKKESETDIQEHDNLDLQGEITPRSTHIMDAQQEYTQQECTKTNAASARPVGTYYVDSNAIVIDDALHEDQNIDVEDEELDQDESKRLLSLVRDTVIQGRASEKPKQPKSTYHGRAVLEKVPHGLGTPKKYEKKASQQRRKP